MEFEFIAIPGNVHLVSFVPQRNSFLGNPLEIRLMPHMVVDAYNRSTLETEVGV